jgi:copper transport protein
MAVSAWLGALPGLLSSLRASEPEAYALLRRFGRLGAVAVTVVLLTGVGSLTFVVLQARGGLGTRYIEVLAGKLVAVTGLLILAAVNRFRLTPAVAKRPEIALPALRRTILAEQAIAICAIAAVAWLGQLDPSM